jgi:hypothetical protein
MTAEYLSIEDRRRSQTAATEANRGRPRFMDVRLHRQCFGLPKSPLHAG